MPVLCFEGPSAVGKSTTARAMDASVVPEANLLFRRPATEAPTWYLDRQVDRWALATNATPGLVVLDGDPLQPLWYNWAFDYVGWQSLDELDAFYRPRIARGEIGFPDLYVLFQASDETLRTRKEGDPHARRRSFEAHLRFVRPQRRYFEAMQDFSPERVCVLDAVTVEENVRAIRQAAEGATPERRPVELFDHLVAWLRQNPAHRSPESEG